ncbi:unnamed protein product [Brassicogethes aeneus]|uniref:Sorting nexin n=1 Tax=Brassicogethes aeneus TaxID=1431903 RepID=A0A9P0FLY1_BRAAE|nr:unnamed protein product [Brassicogethes aeneus]
MSTFKVLALYDFDGEPGSSEMSIKAEEILTITRTDVGEGWWEGLNSKGQSGLFPQAYVQRMKESPPAMPAPVYNQELDDNKQKSTEEEADWDDEWDNDDTYSEIGQGTNNRARESVYANEPNQNYVHGSNSNNTADIHVDNKGGTVSKKSLNRFSNYVKSGLESYMLGTLNQPTHGKKIHVYRDEQCLAVWEPLSNPYTVQVTSPKKATKMGGLKSFIAYSLTPSFSNIEVSRRYKHFDWLHDRMCDKFNIVAVPPLPDKQISGRYEEQFIEHRRVQLQEFVNYVCRHPVLSQCEVWYHFLTCTDEKQWKQGKRQAEKDPFVGANFCMSLESPEKELLQSDKDKIDDNLNYIVKMDQNVKKLMQTCQDQWNKCSNMYKREFHRIGESFFALGSSLDLDGKIPSEVATEVQQLGTVYMQIGRLYEDQARDHWQALSDKLYIYKGITSSIPDVLHLQKSSETKKRDCEKTIQNPLQLNDIRKRGDCLTYAVFAELNHFQMEKNTDLRLSMKTLLVDQIKFYKNIVGQLEDTLSRFN